jgi:hypothetical protein
MEREATFDTIIYLVLHQHMLFKHMNFVNSDREYVIYYVISILLGIVNRLSISLYEYVFTFS